MLESRKVANYLLFFVVRVLRTGSWEVTRSKNHWSNRGLTEARGRNRDGDGIGSGRCVMCFIYWDHVWPVTGARPASSRPQVDNRLYAPRKRRVSRLVSPEADCARPPVIYVPLTLPIHLQLSRRKILQCIFSKSNIFFSLFLLHFSVYALIFYFASDVGCLWDFWKKGKLLYLSFPFFILCTFILFF